MSKIKTEDCLNALDAAYGVRTLWKRRRKFKCGDGIKRIFEDTISGTFWSVYEEDGKIVDISPVDSNAVNAVAEKKVVPIYYALYESFGVIGLVVTDSKHFDKHLCQSDWTPEAVHDELVEIGYPGCEVMEGMIEFYKEVTDIEDLKAKLESSSVFKFNPAFQTFMIEHNGTDNEDFKILPICKKYTWSEIQSNPIKVDLKRVTFPHRSHYPAGVEGDEEFEANDRRGEWSGRVIFALHNDEDDDEVCFFCGPETKDGNLEDTLDGGVTKKLEELFADLDFDPQTSENFHAVKMMQGVTAKEMWQVIRERLSRSGAVHDREYEKDNQ